MLWLYMITFLKDLPTARDIKLCCLEASLGVLVLLEMESICLDLNDQEFIIFKL